jgi:hypothetical protein
MIGKRRGYLYKTVQEKIVGGGRMQIGIVAEIIARLQPIPCAEAKIVAVDNKRYPCFGGHGVPRKAGSLAERGKRSKARSGCLAKNLPSGCGLLE